MRKATEWPERAHRQANRLDDHRPKGPAAKGPHGLGHKRGGNRCAIHRRGPSRAPVPPRELRDKGRPLAIGQKDGGLKEPRDGVRAVVFHHASSSRRLDFAHCGRCRSGLAGLQPRKEPAARLTVYLAEIGAQVASPQSPILRLSARSLRLPSVTPRHFSLSAFLFHF